MDTDEFLIVAKGAIASDEETWTRNNLAAAQMIADQAISRLGYREAKVYNTYGGHKSDALYVVQRVHSSMR
jgi:hypothetical protein